MGFRGASAQESGCTGFDGWVGDGRLLVRKIDALSGDPGTLKTSLVWLVWLLPPAILALRCLCILLLPSSD